MAVITLEQITELQYRRHNKVLNQQLKQLNGKYSSRGSRNAHRYAHIERHKCWPRGKTYYRLYRRQMNPHINFTVSPGHPDRYKHMSLRMWS